MSVSERWQVARDNRLCYRCLATNHRGVDCLRSAVYGIDNCQETHNRLLHHEKLISKQESYESEKRANELEHEVDESEHEVEEFSNTAIGEEQSRIALRTIPVIVRNGTKSIAINALLDDGSTRTYINADIAAELGLLTGDTDEITVGTMGGAKRTFSNEEVSFVIESAENRADQLMPLQQQQ